MENTALESLIEMGFPQNRAYVSIPKKCGNTCGRTPAYLSNRIMKMHTCSLGGGEVCFCCFLNECSWIFIEAVRQQDVGKTWKNRRVGSLLLS